MFNKIHSKLKRYLDLDFSENQQEEIIAELLFVTKISKMIGGGPLKYKVLPRDFFDLITFSLKKPEDFAAIDLSNVEISHDYLDNFDPDDEGYDDFQFRRDVYNETFKSNIRTEYDQSLKMSPFADYHDLSQLYNQVMYNLHETFDTFSDPTYLGCMNELSRLTETELIEFAIQVLIKDDPVNEATPTEFVDFILSLFKQNSLESVIELCSGKGSFALQLKEFGHCYSQELYKDKVYIARILAFISGQKNLRVESGDIFSNLQLHKNGEYYRAKNVFCHPTWVSKLPASISTDINNAKWNRKKIQYSNKFSPDWAFCISVVNMMDKGGLGVAIVSNGSLVKLTDYEIRKQFIEMKLIKAVVHLPKDIFDFYAPESSLVVFAENSNTIKMIDARKMYKEGRRVNKLDVSKLSSAYFSDSEVNVHSSLNQVSENDYSLNVVDYLDMSESLENVESIKPYIVKAFRGIQLSAKELDDLTITHDQPVPRYMMATLSNLNNDVLDRDMPYVVANDDRFDKYLLEDGDVIISSKSSKIKTSYVAIDDDEKIFASGNIIVLRLDKSRISSKYVKVFLDSKLGQRSLASLQTGSVILSINPSQLEKLFIPIPEISKQLEIAQKYQSLIDVKRIYQQKINKTDDEIASLFEKETGRMS